MEVGHDDAYEMQDIKTNPVSAKQLDWLADKSGGYEAMFSKRAMLYRERGLQNQLLSEADYRSLILEQYTFLKRPVLVLNHKVFVGNTRKVVEAIKAELAVNV